MLTDKEVKNLFFNLEKQSGIFDYKINGISTYHILRFPIEMQLRFAKGKRIEESKFEGLKAIGAKLKARFKAKKKIQRIENTFDKPFNAKYSPFLFVGTCSLINEEGSSVDLYEIIKYFFKKKISINFALLNYQTTPFPIKSKYYHSFLPLNIDSRRQLSREEKKTIYLFLKEAEEILNINLVVKYSDYLNHVSVVLGKAEDLRKYILKLKPQFVFARSVYSASWIPIACQGLKTKLVEVQHGVVTDDSIYFQSNVGGEGLKAGHLLMPDFILTIGEEWRKIIVQQDSSFNESNVFNIGTEEYSPNSIEKKIIPNVRVLFILQGRRFNQLTSIPDFISKFLTEFQEGLDVEIVVRPHPNDIGEVDGLIKLFNKEIVIEDSAAVTSIESIKKSDYIIGATSMCLYEALAYGKTAVSFSQFKGMAASNRNIVFLDSPKDLYHLLKEPERKIKNRLPYLDSFNGEVLDSFLVNKDYQNK